MKKTVLLFIAAFLTVSVFSQTVKKNYPDLLTKAPRQKEVSLNATKDLYSIFKEQNNLTFTKASNAANHHLDSVIIEAWDKDEYLYNADGNVIRNTYFEWGGDQWYGWYKYEYTYDEKGQLANTIYSELYETGWTQNWKFARTYDAKGNPLKNSGSYWTGSAWETNSTSEFIFDSNDHKMQVMTKISYGNGLENEFKEAFAYDSAGNLTVSTQFRWENNMWVNNIENRSTFDSSGNQLQYVVYSWDGSKWNEADKVEYIYNEHNKINQSDSYTWSQELNDWSQNSQAKNNFDENGNQTLFNLFMNGINSWQVESVYDEFGNKTAKITSYWNDLSQKLEPSIKADYTYDTAVPFAALILPTVSEDFYYNFELDIFTSKMTRLAYSSWTGTAWSYYYDLALSYSDNVLTGVKNLNTAAGLTAYPNPAADQVTFRIDDSSGRFTVNLYNIQGKLVLSQESHNDKPVSVESLNEGIYFYRITKDMNSYTGKFMVK